MEFLNSIALSFFSPHLYNATARAGKGIGGKFILALTIITTLVLALEFGGSSTGFFATIKKLPDMVRTFPVMTMKNAKLSIDKPAPYEIKLGDTDLRIVIDTSYKMADVTSLKEKVQNENIIMLLTEDAFIGRGNNGELKVQDFKNMQDFTATHDDWEAVANWLEGWGIPLIITGVAAVSLFSFFIYNLIATFLSAIVVTILGSVLRASLEFDAAMRLAAVARLPASVISLLPFIRPGVGWLIWAAYLIFAVVACRVPPSSKPAA